VHPVSVGAADGAACDQIWDAQRSDRCAWRLGSRCVGEDPWRSADGGRLPVCGVREVARRRRGGAMADGQGLRGVVRPTAYLRRGAVADRSVVRPRPRPSQPDVGDQARRPRCDGAREGDARRSPRLRRRVSEPGRTHSSVEALGREHPSSSTSTTRCCTTSPPTHKNARQSACPTTSIRGSQPTSTRSSGSSKPACIANH
jgi:hypothetical protein